MPWPPLATGRCPGSARGLFLEPLALHGSIFVVFWSSRNLIEKSCFFDFHKNRKKWTISGHLAARGSIFCEFSWLLGSILASIFRLFLELRKAWNRWQFHTLRGFGIPKPVIFRFFFYPFFDLRSGTFLGWHFWRQKHRSTLKMAIFGAPSDFKGYQNGPRISTFWPKNV